MLYDSAIVGGGVIGCALLNKLTRKGLKVVLLEKENDVSLGASKANSGLIHAGFDCEPNSLKAKFNVRGNQLIYKLCEELGVGAKMCGAIVIGNNEKSIKQLYNRGIANNVQGLSILNRAEVLKKVPNVTDEITCGLYAKSAGTISSYMFTIALAEESVLNGAEVILNANIKSIKKLNDIYKINYNKTNITAKCVINAAGAGYNEIAKILKSEEYKIEFRRGEYYLLDSQVGDYLNLTIFPLPDRESKGVLLSPTVDGNIIIGPTSYVSDISTKTTKSGLLQVKTKANKMLKDIPFKYTIRNFSGIRTVVGDDFIIEKSKKCGSVINLAGICSPGLTAAPAIAEYVAEVLLNLKCKDKVMIKRKPYTKVLQLSDNEISELIKEDDSYGKIVCKCEGITLGEVKEVLLSPLKPVSLDAIKRRVRVGMGRCQGGFCLTKAINFVSETLKIDKKQVVKEKNNTYFYVSEINPKGSKDEK